MMTAKEARELSQKVLNQKVDAIVSDVTRCIDEAIDAGNFSCNAVWPKKLSEDVRIFLTNHGYTSEYLGEADDCNYCFLVSWNE